MCTVPRLTVPYLTQGRPLIVRPVVPLIYTDLLEFVLCISCLKQEVCLAPILFPANTEMVNGSMLVGFLLSGNLSSSLPKVPG
jgi:hypothetical protein